MAVARAEERFLFLEERLASPDVAQKQDEFTKIMKEYKNRSIIIGKTVTVLNNGTYTARVLDITDDAHLVVEGEHGKEELFTGDVSIRL